MKEHVLNEGQRSFNEKEYEVNDHAAPICGFPLKCWSDPDLPSLPYVCELQRLAARRYHPCHCEMSKLPRPGAERNPEARLWLRSAGTG